MTEDALQAEIARLRGRVDDLTRALERAVTETPVRPVPGPLPGKGRNDCLRAALASIADAVFVVDAAGTVMFLNSAAERWTGWTEEAAVGRPSGDVIHLLDEQTREPAPDLVGRLLQAESVLAPPTEILLLARDGREIPVECSAAPMLDSAGNVSGAVLVLHDLTAMRCGQAAAAKSHAEAVAERNRLSAVMEALPSGVALVDECGGNPKSNPAFDRIWGGPRPQPLSISDYSRFKAWWADTGRPVAPDEWASARAVLNGETVLNQELQIERFDGGRMFVLNSAAPIRDAEGRIAGSAVSITDITPLKLAEAEVEAGRRKYQALIETTNDFIWEMDAHGRYTYCSPHMETLWGYKPAEMIGRTPFDLMPPEEAKRVAEVFGGIARSPRPFSGLEAESYDGAGRLIHIQANGVPILDGDGGLIGFRGISRDITEQKRAEDALRASEEQFRTLANAIPHLCWVAEPDGSVFWFNQRWYDYTGAAPESMEGWGWQSVHDPKELPDVLERWRRSLTTGEPFDMVYSLKGADGVFRPFLTRGMPLRGHDGRIIRWFGANTDISEQRRVEAALRETQKLESLGLLAGGVAHDFNNLLVGVLGNASLAQEMVPPDHPVAPLLQRIIATGEQAAHLTRQMLAYAGKGRFLVEPLDLAALARDMTDLLRLSIPKNTVLELSADADGRAVEADRGQMQQVIMNLVLNAAEAIGGREGLITVRTGAQSVDDAWARSHPEAMDLRRGPYVALEVCDNGCGMDDRVRARIFDPFFTTKCAGRGLGLAAVAGIVRGHGGAIVVASQPGRGSSFTVLLPPCSQPVRERGAAPARAVRGGSGVVLVVDDEPIVREMASRCLTRYGYTVLVAYDALAAIDILKRHPSRIDLVLLDLSMPGMSGQEALPRLKSIRPEVRILISSGYSEAETMNLLKGQPVAGFVPKPYTAAGVAERVRRALA